MNLFIKLVYLSILTNFSKGFSYNTKDVENKTVPGIHLQYYNSYTCRELPIKILEDFQICFFTKSKPIKSRYVNDVHLVHLSDTNSFITLDQDFLSFNLNVNGKITKYQKQISFTIWKKICLHKKENASDIEININYRQPNKYSFNDEEEFNIWKEEFEKTISEKPTDVTFGWNSSFSSFIPRDGNASICFGNPYASYSPYNITIAGLHLSHLPLTTGSENDNCTLYLQNVELQDFGDQIWNSNNFVQFNITITELCLDSFVFAFINQSGNYEEHTQICNHLNGRLLYLEELQYFLHNLRSLISHNESSSISTWKDNVIFQFWLYGGTTQAKYNVFCPSFTLLSNSSFKEQRNSCYYNMNFSYCIAPHGTHFIYYGSLKKYERNFFLTQMDFTFGFSGKQGSYIEQRGNKWMLSSIHHQETYEIKSTLPVGRQLWTSTKDGTKIILTFTHCKSNKEFACSDGTCLPWNVRCNGLVDCSDNSDEENCIQLVKNKGYSIHLPPPPKAGEESPNFYYDIELFNIHDITSVSKSIKIEIGIFLSWYDPRIEFWNFALNENINMKDIWTPELILVGNGYPGYKLKMNDGIISCKSDPKFFETNGIRNFSYQDPFMGTFIRGEDMKILYSFRAVMDVPCRFNLRRYPFGKQSCNIFFWVENTEHNETYYKFVYNGKNKSTSEVIYNGSKELGEYNFVSADHIVGEFDDVRITIHLENLYGFHMLNSFVPSVLICIITYSTLFFPIVNFSDRVMVSLTALLVLAALFTQSSNTSVITPYFKLLDIWYVVLIFYCFMIVIFNIWLHKVNSIEERKAKKIMKNFKDDNHDQDNAIKYMFIIQWKKKLVLYNFMAIVFFSLFYILFIFFFCLAAVGIV